MLTMYYAGWVFAELARADDSDAFATFAFDATRGLGNADDFLNFHRGVSDWICVYKR